MIDRKLIGKAAEKAREMAVKALLDICKTDGNAYGEVEIRIRVRDDGGTIIVAPPNMENIIFRSESAKPQRR